MTNKSGYIDNDYEEQKIVARERIRKYQDSKHI